MANTDKQNFRCDTETRWGPAMKKVAEMRDAGYNVDMTMIMVSSVEFVRDATPEEIAERFGLTIATPVA